MSMRPQQGLYYNQSMGSDIWLVLRFWGTLFLIGAVAFPLTKLLFSPSGLNRKEHQGLTPGWFDDGYLFSKAVGMAVVTYFVYLAGMLGVAPFTVPTIAGAMGVVFVGGIVLLLVLRGERGENKRMVFLLAAEELFFLVALVFWSWVKGHEPDIHGLEKFMDFGFTKSILNNLWFPAPDMWYAGLPINYYYFGHTVLAVLTKLSALDLAHTFNLMLAALFALTLTMSFSLGVQLVRGVRGIGMRGKMAGGILTSFLVTLAGNMQTIYAFTKGYVGENVRPFWTLAWSIGEIGEKLAEGMERYWYANATRFIPYTIHEFPSYSFVVSDIHGHVLSLPFVLLAVALLIHMFNLQGDKGDKRDKGEKIRWGNILFYGFLCGVLLMTNALDGPIYLGLFVVLLVATRWTNWKQIMVPAGLVAASAALTSLPFLSHFTSFVSGVAINCPPAFLANSTIGPFLFEGVEKCQHSPLWMLWLLWGFFLFCGAFLIVRAARKADMTERLLVVVFLFSIALIVFPEFFYFKDIYPAHFRSNTMFKLGYQAYILFSIVSGYTIVTVGFRDHYDPEGKSKILNPKHKIHIGRTVFLMLLAPQLFLVSIYPIFAVRSYFGELRQYKGLYGLAWLKMRYPDDWQAIRWLNDQVVRELPVIVEADGDSYTDYARYSAFTGLPTIIGWPVHEWLWRGSYDVVGPRREDVRRIYESTDVNETRELLAAYGVRYIVVGLLEREKFQNLAEWKFAALGTVVFRQGITTLYQVREPIDKKAGRWLNTR